MEGMTAVPLACIHLHGTQKKSEVWEKMKNPFSKLEAPIQIYVHYMERREQEA